MATTIQSFGLDDSPFNVSESDLENTAIMDIKAGVAGQVDVIDIDNSANAASSFFKGYDNVNPTIGTTDPDLIILVQASVRRQIIFVEGFEFTNFSMACVTAAGTAGVTSPTSSVIVEVQLS